MSSVCGITFPIGTSLDAIPGLGPVVLDRIIGHLVFAYAGEKSFSNAMVFDLYGGYVAKLDKVRSLDEDKHKRLSLALTDPDYWKFKMAPTAVDLDNRTVHGWALKPRYNLDDFERMYLAWLQGWITGSFTPCTSMRFSRFISTLIEDLIFSENWRDDIAFMKETEAVKPIEHRQPAGWFVNGACHTDFPLLTDRKSVV